MTKSEIGGHTRPMRLVASLAVVLLIATVGLAATNRGEANGMAANGKSTSSGGQPPIIDRELLFGDPVISGAQISPDGQFIAFIKPLNGTRNIWVKRTAAPFDSAKPLTNDTKRPIPVYFWSRDGKFILYVQDKGGDENFNVYAVNPGDTPVAGQDVPTSRNLTDLKGVRAFLYDAPKSNPDLLYVGINDRDPAWPDLYSIKISTGERALIRKNTDRITGWVFDQKGQLRLATRSADNGDTEVLRVDATGMTKVYSCNVFESCSPLRFTKDGRQVYMDTNKGDDVDLSRLELFDPETGKESVAQSDPEHRVDFGGAIFSEATDELVGTSYIDEQTRVYWINKGYEGDYNFLKKQLPGKEVSFSSSTADEQVFLVTAHSDTEPGETYLFDRRTKKLTLQYRVREKLSRQDLASMKGVRYPSSDGLEIPAYLTLPKGMEAKNLPVVIFPHGGPWARDVWGYNPFAQFLANRGYAVLMPNFRGSTGYGKKFLNAGNREWGQKMQDDITWGVKYLVSKGIADPKRVAIMGASYGGYATLAGVTVTPDLYAAAVDYCGPSNLITLMDSIPPYWESIRKMFYRRMGDPTTADGKAQLERQSPLNYADKIKTPLLVVQGANDPRVNRREADRIVVALRDRGFPAEYILAPDEGHGFSRPVNNMAMFATAEKFLAHYIGGRYQEDMTAEVSTRLKDITVDVKSLTVAKPAETVAAGNLRPAVDLQPGTANYQAKIEMGGQSIPLSMSRTIKDENGAWLVSETAKTPQGDVTDATTLEKGSLVVKKWAIHQGPVVIDLDLKDNKATGSMTVNGSNRPINVDLGGPLFADGAGAYDVIAALPLAEGYSAVFRNLDVQKQKVKLMQLKVLGKEKIGTSGDTAYKVEVSSADGGPDKSTVWIAQDSRKILKVTATLPDLGGATLTMELQP
ncbi:MAG TPA: alpha/beta fold hydrolase [Blastocatellia bacterium]